MLGEKQRSEPMFYYVRIEYLVPENHLLRLIDKHIDFSFVANKVKHLCDGQQEQDNNWSGYWWVDIGE
ncbi:MAG: hypothetical protein HZC10_01830 [Nitrospirae bacterium]|nr:hypothetical protein [Nitrospirota bacterium]